MGPRRVMAIVVAGALVALAWSQWRGGQAEAQEGLAVVERATVARRDMARYVEAVGVVEPAFVLEVKSKASGEITSMPYEEGDRVEEGALLVELRPVDEERNLRRQKAAVLAAEARLAKAENAIRVAQVQLRVKGEQNESQLEKAEVDFEVAQAEYQRRKSLFARELVSRSELDAARGNAEQAEAALELARTQRGAIELDRLAIEDRRQEARVQAAALESERVNLEVAELRLSETRIHAPMAGLVLERPVERGQIIASGISNVSGGTTLMSLADVSALFLEAEVDESDIGGIRAGLPVELSAEAYPDMLFHGEVERVAPRGVEEQNITIFRVRIQLGRQAIQRLKPGMNCTAQIIVARTEGALVVPTKAIQRRDELVGVLVDVPEDAAGEPRFVEVELGIRDAEQVAVTGDLEEGDQVLLRQDGGGGRGDGGRGRGRSMRAGYRAARRAGGS